MPGARPFMSDMHALYFSAIFKYSSSLLLLVPCSTNATIKNKNLNKFEVRTVHRGRGSGMGVEDLGSGLTYAGRSVFKVVVALGHPTLVHRMKSKHTFGRHEP